MTIPCRDCGKPIVGLALAHCTVCHETFRSNGVADEHWSKKGHVDPDTVSRLVRDNNGIFRRAGTRPTLP